MNLHDQIPLFLQQGILQKGYSPSTVKGYGATLRRYARWLDARPEAEPFALEVLRTYLVEKEKIDGLRPRSIHHQHGALKAFAAWLVDTGALESNPVGFVRQPRLDERLVKGATEPEARALLDACDRLTDPPVRRALAKAALSTLLYTGVRNSELLALTTEDVNLSERRLLVRCGKGGKSRSIPINTELHAALKDWLAVRRAPSIVPALFLTRPTHGLTVHSLREILRDVRAVAGLRDRVHLTPHSFRRFFATLMSRNGVSLATISRLLGHSSVNVTCQYLMFNEAELEQAVEMAVPRQAVPAVGDRPLLRTVEGKRREKPTGPRKSIRLRIA